MTDEQRIRKIEQVLEQLRPNIQMDGGDITFVKYVDGVVYVKLHGACAGCALSTQTLKMGVEQALRDEISDVYEVQTVEQNV
ncbi:NifU family protein [Candidatus Dependentiae bacterium]|nr:NifU family protein [Candidatus Dependentiae bacterium]